MSVPGNDPVIQDDRKGSPPSTRWFLGLRSHPGQDRLESWCQRHVPTLSRRFLSYGRDGILGPLFAFLALGCFGRWWDWSHGGGPMGGAVGWTVGASVVLLLAKRWWVVGACPLAWVAAQSLLHSLVEQRSSHLLLGLMFLAAVVAVCGLGMWLDGGREG
jgi:hypothetical protein